MSTRAWSQKVYRCGASYSQLACADAVAVEAADPRSPAQKSQADKAIVRDAALADSLEKDRLHREAQALGQAQHPGQQGKAATHKTKARTTHASAGNKGKKKNAPEFFTAKAAPDSAAKKPDTKRKKAKQGTTTSAP